MILCLCICLRVLSGCVSVGAAVCLCVYAFLCVVSSHLSTATNKFEQVALLLISFRPCVLHLNGYFWSTR